jgi:hypothetical protein
MILKTKSKADWLLKGIAVSQIMWLVLNVAVRGFTKLPSDTARDCYDSFLNNRNCNICGKLVETERRCGTNSPENPDHGRDI